MPERTSWAVTTSPGPRQNRPCKLESDPVTAGTLRPRRTADLRAPKYNDAYDATILPNPVRDGVAGVLIVEGASDQGQTIKNLSHALEPQYRCPTQEESTCRSAYKAIPLPPLPCHPRAAPSPVHQLILFRTPWYMLAAPATPASPSAAQHYTIRHIWTMGLLHVSHTPHSAIT